MLLGCVATSDDIRGIYARQARLEAKTEKLYQDVEALKRKTQASDDKELGQQVTQLEKKLENMEQSYSELRERLDEIERRETTSGFPSASQPEAPAEGITTTTSELESESRVFSEGYKNLSEGRYEDARDRFKFFLSKYPNSVKAPDAEYWIAESYYREGKFEEAILEFQQFIETYPRDSRVPLSYLKQGLSLINIGRKEEARIFLQTLIDKFPKSEEAKVAQEKLSELAGKR
jgi:tol-pal system protein YbgF